MKPIHKRTRLNAAIKEGSIKKATFIGSVDGSDCYLCTYPYKGGCYAYIIITSSFFTESDGNAWAQIGSSLMFGPNDPLTFEDDQPSPEVFEFIQAHHNLHS